MFQVFNPETLDRILALEQHKRKPGLLDGHVLNAMKKYLEGLFAADTMGLARPRPIWEEYEDDEPQVVGWEPAQPGLMAEVVAAAYADYVAELAWGGPGVPARDWGVEHSDGVNDLITEDLQWALAICDKLGIETDEVVEYYRSRSQWMPTPGTTWATVRQQALSQGKWSTAS